MLVDYRHLTTEPRQTIHELYKNLEMNVSEQYDQYLIEHEQKEKSHKTHFRYSREYVVSPVEKIEQQLDEFSRFTTGTDLQKTPISLATIPTRINYG